MGIGWSEMFIIGVIALMVLGEDKFPDFVKVAIRAFRDFRGYWDEIKGEVQREVSKPLEKELQPLRRELQQLSRMDPETYINKLTNSALEDKPKIEAAPPVEEVGSPTPSAEDESHHLRAGDDPAGNMNSEDAKIMAAGTTPYAGGGLGARPTPVEAATPIEPAGEAERSTVASNETQKSEHDDLSPPTRID